VARIVIADAGPLIAFASADLLFVLQALFSKVTITESVHAECGGKPGEDSERIHAAIEAGWLSIERTPATTEVLSPSLGAGESDSIRLALRNAEDTLLIMDCWLARRYALRRGLNLVGTARLLDLAEQRGLVSDAAACIAQMIEHSYRIAPDLLEHIRTRPRSPG
jgi:predicted nucleic acid-binding protein